MEVISSLQIICCIFGIIWNVKKLYKFNMKERKKANAPVIKGNLKPCLTKKGS
jgi:hypothetical protein